MSYTLQGHTVCSGFYVLYTTGHSLPTAFFLDFGSLPKHFLFWHAFFLHSRSIKTFHIMTFLTLTTVWLFTDSMHSPQRLLKRFWFNPAAEYSIYVHAVTLCIVKVIIIIIKKKQTLHGGM